MGTPSLGWAGSYGAAGAAEGLEDLLKRKLTERVQAEQERRARAIEAAEAARLAQAQAQMEQQGEQFGLRHALDTEELGERRRQFDAGSNQRGLELMKGEAELQDIGAGRAARERLRNDPTYGRIIGLREAGVQTSPIDPMDPTGEVEHERKKEHIVLSGDQNVRSANASRAGRVVPIRTKDASGKNVTRYVSIDEATSQDWEVQDTAGMRDKEEARGRLGQSIDAIRQLGEKVITKRGIAQRATALGRSVESALGNDPEYKVYQDARLATAGNLAVAQQGSRPSDTDVVKIWLPMVPDAISDTDESSALKWRLIDMMSGRETSSTGGTGQSLDPNPPADAAATPAKRKYTIVR